MSKIEPKKIIIAEDHPMISKGLKQLIKSLDANCEIYVVNSCQELLSASSKIKPQSFIIDLYLEDGLSIDTMENLLRLYPDCNIMVYTSFPGKMYVSRLFKIGVHGFINKNNSEDELIFALKKFLANQFYLSNDFIPLILPHSKKEETIHNPFLLLSTKELMIVEYLCKGIHIKEIAEKMGIKSNTAATYKIRAYEKLKVNNLLELYHLFTEKKAIV